MKPVGKPDAGNPHVRFDERGWETGRRIASVLAPILDSTAATDLINFSGLGDGKCFAYNDDFRKANVV